MPYRFNPILGELNLVNNGTVTNVTATTPLFSSGGTTPNLTIQQANTGQSGFLSAADWNTFNNKLDASRFNYITNPGAEIDTAGWNLYNDAGRTVPASLINQDLTYTSTLSGDAGNGVNIEYIYNASFPSSTPNINVISSTHVQVQWNNGPTIANNPTATQLKAAWDAVPAATAIATLAISGTPTKLQYIVGAEFLSNGGDTSPVDGTGGVVTGVTLTRTLVNPLVGIASFDLGKDANNREGTGVSTDFIINNLDKGQQLQISFAYDGLTGMVLGSLSDVRVFIYDITNATLIPVTPLATIAGPINTAKTFVGQFTASGTSINYRLILHIATMNTTAWDFIFDNVIVGDVLNPTATTQVPSLVLKTQPISGAVTDHMCVMWRDGATQWVPATIAGAAIPVFGTDKTQLGFATNIIGSTADVYIRGAMDGFSFGPFVGFEQYIDNIAGGISPLPSPFTDLYVMVGMAISSTILNIQFDTHVDLIANGSGVPIKGGLLTSSAINDGTGDLVISPGTNGSVLFANSAQTLGLQYGAAVVVASPFTYTTATRTLSVNSQTANTFYAAPNGSAGVPSFRAIVAADIPTLNQNTTGSAAKWTTARLLAGNSVDGSANVPFANKFIVQGTTDAGLSNAQFLGALGTGIVKNTTTTGVLSIAVAGDFPTLNQNTTGTASNVTGVVALVNGGTGTAAASANAAFNALSPMTTLGDIIYENATPVAARLAGNTTSTKNFLTQTGNGTISAAPVWGTIAAGDVPTLNQNTTGSAASFTGSLAGDVTGTQGATVISAATVTGKLLTGYAVGANTALAATDTILGAFGKVQGQLNAKAPLASPVFTGDVNVSTGNLLISTIGKGLQVKTGTNAKIGTAVLVAGTVTVANTSVTANSRIFLTVQSLGTVAVATPIAVTAKVVGTSFTITSSSVTDTSTIAWMIVESIP